MEKIRQNFQIIAYIVSAAVVGLGWYNQYVTMRNEVVQVRYEINEVKQQIKDYNVLTYKVNTINDKMCEMDKKVDQIRDILMNKQ